MKKRRQFTPEFKSKIVLSMLTGSRTKADICREHQLHPNVVERWTNEFVKAAPSVFTQKQPNNGDATRIAELERMVGRLTMENDILKKAHHLIDLDLKKSGSY